LGVGHEWDSGLRRYSQAWKAGAEVPEKLPT
jgi:hypothetical protein